MIGQPTRRNRRAILAATVAASLWLVAASSAAADDPVLTIDWQASPPSSGEVVDGRARISAGAEGGTFALLAIHVPDLGRVGYEITGDVRYDGVVGRGYLEMWSVFPDGNRYFARTLDDDGPTAVLTGSSDDRPAKLIFLLNGSPPPSIIEVNVVLPGAGTVEVGPLSLRRLTVSPGTGGAEPDGAWIPERMIGVLGAGLGTTIGVLGALIGSLVRRGRARGPVIAAMTVATGVGVALIAASVVALVASQPTGVLLFLFVPGVILAGVFGSLLPGVRRAYAEGELRRMRALDRG